MHLGPSLLDSVPRTLQVMKFLISGWTSPLVITDIRAWCMFACILKITKLPVVTYLCSGSVWFASQPHSHDNGNFSTSARPYRGMEHDSLGWTTGLGCTLVSLWSAICQYRITSYLVIYRTGGPLPTASWSWIHTTSATRISSWTASTST